MLEVKNLTKQYGEKVVVDDLSFSISEPGVYALLGTNGAGKTTSIRMILGMLAKNGGEVLWNGKPFTAAEMNVGYLAEERGLYPKYSLSKVDLIGDAAQATSRLSTALVNFG